MRAALEYEGIAQTVEGQRVAGTADEWLVTVQGRERRVRFASAAAGHVLSEADGRAWASEVCRTRAGLEMTAANRTHRFGWALGERHHAAADARRDHGLTSPMPGLVLKVLVRPGEKVRARQTLIVLEAMKMEHNIEAPYDGTVKTVNCAEGGRVAEGAVLIELEQDGAK